MPNAQALQCCDIEIKHIQTNNKHPDLHLFQILVLHVANPMLLTP